MVLKVLMILPIGKSKSAFTLIELLLVLILIGVVISMSVVAMPHGDKVQLRDFSRQLVIDFQYAQASSIDKGVNVEVVFNTIDQQYVINTLDTTPVQLRKRNIVKGMSIVQKGEALIFYPDGSSSQVDIQLSMGKETVLVSKGMHRFRWTIEYAGDEEII